VVSDVSGSAASYREAEADSEADDREDGRRDSDASSMGRSAQEDGSCEGEREADGCFGDAGSHGSKRPRAAQYAAEMEGGDRRQRRRLEDHQQRDPRETWIGAFVLRSGQGRLWLSTQLRQVRPCREKLAWANSRIGRMFGSSSW
jgi:hypothetical protein